MLPYSILLYLTRIVIINNYLMFSFMYPLGKSRPKNDKPKKPSVSLDFWH